MPYVSPFKSSSVGAAPATPNSGLGYVSPFKNSYFTQEYATQRKTMGEQQTKLDNLNKTLQGGDVDAMYKSLRDARAEGLITKDEQLGVLKNINTSINEQGAKNIKDATSVGAYANEAWSNIKNIPATLVSAYNTVGTGLGEYLGYEQTARASQTQREQQQQASDIIINLTRQRNQATDQTVKDRMTQAIKNIENQRQQTYSNQAQRFEELTYNLDPIRNAAAIAEIGMDILTAGQLVGAKNAAKIGMKTGQVFTSNLAKSLAKVSAKGLASAPAKKALNVVATNAAKQAIPGSLAGALSAIEQKGSQATAQDIFVGAVTGGAMGAALGTISGAMTAKQITKLEQAMSKAKLTKDIMPDLNSAKLGELVPEKPVDMVTAKPIDVLDTPQVTNTGTLAEQLPATPVGEQKVSGAALKTQAEIGQELGDKATYTVESYKANKVTADDFVRNNKNEALKIINDQTDTTPAKVQETYKALDKLAKETSDVDLAQQLASSKAPTELSEAAQALGQRGYDLDPTSPTDAIRAIRKEATKKIEARTKGTLQAATTKEIKKITASVKAPTRQDWASFIEELRCV